MAKQTLFQKLKSKSSAAGMKAGSAESVEWYRNQVRNMVGLNRREILKDKSLGKNTNDPVVGQMAMFIYDPKHKDTLPYYDTFPLTVIVGPAKDGFYGLNLHYLPPVLRAKMLDALLETASSNKTANTKMKISYDMLTSVSQMRFYKPCFKHYLAKHVKSNIRIVDPDFWDIATMLPLQKFKGGSPDRIWADSRSMI